MIIDSFTIIEKPSFLDYLRSGWNVNLSTAIDFTASNGEPYDRSSLHYVHNDGNYNEYELAISSVGSILEPYAF